MNRLFLLSLLIWPLTLFAQNSIAITGVVLDSITLEPLARANVLIEGTEMGAAANKAGEFVIEHVPPGS